MAVIVFGGAGFIGSHLCKSLRDDHEVVAVDNLTTGSLDNIPNGVELRIGDAASVDVSDKDIEFIYNLACPASPVAYQRQPLQTLHACFGVTLHGLELARRTGATFIHASTSEVYGDPTVHPQSESYFGNVNTWGPRACYDEGKRVAETLCYEYSKGFGDSGMRISVARIFNTYGPNMARDDGRVVSNFITQALENKPITVYGNGNQTRSFCYVSDMVRALIHLAYADVDGPVNLGNPDEITVMDMAKLVKAECRSKSKIVCRKLPKDDPTRRKPDIKKATERLGWEPRVSLEDGIRRTVRYFAAG